MTDTESNPLYTLRHDRNGRAKEVNNLSPALPGADAAEVEDCAAYAFKGE